MSNSVSRIQFAGFEWIDIHIPDVSNLEAAANEFGLELYQLQDSFQIGHLPKYEKKGEEHFLILRAFTANLKKRITNINELSNKIAFFYNPKRIITLHRAEFEFLSSYPQAQSPEELMLYFVEKMTETFAAPAHFLSEKVDDFEKKIFVRKTARVSLQELYYHKAHTRISRKLLQFTLTTVAQIKPEEQNVSLWQNIKDQLQGYLLTYDEVMDDSLNLMNTFLSVNAQKNNDAMRFLTIFSAIFLPLTFIVGIYGMNFEYMPELHWKSGYGLVWLSFLVTTTAVIYWFKRQNLL